MTNGAMVLYAKVCIQPPIAFFAFPTLPGGYRHSQAGRVFGQPFIDGRFWGCCFGMCGGCCYIGRRCYKGLRVFFICTRKLHAGTDPLLHALDAVIAQRLCRLGVETIVGRILA